MATHSEQSDSMLDSPLFLTNYHETIQSHIRSKPTFQNSYVNIQNWFEETAQLLSRRKERAQKHRQRIKEMESEFLHKKGTLQHSLEEKFAISQKLRNKSMREIQDRLRKVSDRHSKVAIKSKVKHQQQITRNLQERKSFEPEDYSYNSKYSRPSRSSSSENRVEFRIQKVKGPSKQVERKLQEYQQRQQHARDLSIEYKRQLAQRARSHNSIEVPDVKMRAELIQQTELRLMSHRVGSRLDQLNWVRQHKEQQLQQRNSKQNKSYRERVKKIQGNLVQIEQERKNKYDSLAQKLERQTSRPGGREARTGKSKNLLENLHVIGSQQAARADKIMEKHREIDYKNKLFRDQREYLMRNYKNTFQ